MTPVSAIRTSIDKSFRIRSHSNDVHHRQRSGTTTIEEERKKFWDKVTAEDELAAQEDIRRREKAEQKAARKIERGHRRSSASEGRSHRSKSDPLAALNEKRIAGILGPDDIHAATGEEFEEYPSRSNTYTSHAKHKTHGAWTTFVMWFRTRFIRIGKRKGSA